MRRLAALVVIAAIATLVPVVAWASLASGSCCAAKNAPPPAPMKCCAEGQCSMSGAAPVPVAPNEAEAPSQAPKSSSPGLAVLDEVTISTASAATRSSSDRHDAQRSAVPVDRRLALLATYLI
jgi:hypothetical protein